MVQSRTSLRTSLRPEVNAITIGIEADMSIQSDEEEMTWSLSLEMLKCGTVIFGHGMNEHGILIL